MRNRLSLAFLVFVALITIAAVVPVETLRVYNAANHTKISNITQNGTALAVDTGITAAGALSGASASITGALAVDTSTLVVDAANNRVGIGTATPSTLLHLSSADTNLTIDGTTDNAILTLNSGIDVGGKYSVIRLKSGGLRKWTIEKNSSDNFNIYDHAGSKSIITAYTNGNLVLMPTSGNVGIGTATVGEKLTVKGNISISAGTYVTLPGGCRDWGKRAAAPTSPAPVEGDRFWNTTTHAISYYNGSTWS